MTHTGTSHAQTNAHTTNTANRYSMEYPTSQPNSICGSIAPSETYRRYSYMTIPNDQVRGHVWASICQTCKRCRDDRGVEKCDDTACPLNRYINAPWEWRSWNVFRMAHALLEHCYSECGAAYSVCQNINNIAPHCPSFRGKQAAIQMDKPKQKRTDRSCRPITGNQQEVDVCQS